jgi:hypothetical protein
VEFASRSPVLHFFLAECYRAKGHPDWALAEYRKTIRLEPRFRDAYLKAGEILAKQHRLGEAAWMASQLVEAYEEIGMVTPADRRLVEGVEQAMNAAGQSRTPMPDASKLSLKPERLLHESREDPGADGKEPR